MFALFSCSAWVVVCWGIVIMFSEILLQPNTTFSSDKLIALVLGGAITVVSIVAFLLIIFGMAFHCLSNSNFSNGTKILWSIFAFLTAPFGAAIYFFTVYKRQTKKHLEVVNG
jgi:hypothetical protein